MSSRVLAAGFLVNTVIAVPNNYLIGVGRVDVAPKYQAFELAAFTALTWAGAKLWGIKGVAAASALRLAAFSVFLLIASFTAGRIRPAYVWKHGLSGPLAALGLLAAGLAVCLKLRLGLWGAGACVLAFAAAAYFRLLDVEERRLLSGLLRLRRSAAPAGTAGTEGRG